LNPGKTKAFMVAFVLLLTGLMTAGVAYATALAPNNALTMEGPGLTIAEGGVGLQGLTQATINHNNDPSNPLPEISVTIGGPVEKAFLYWAGRQRPCDKIGSTCGITATPYRDQELVFDGNPIQGQVVGEESQLSADGASGQNIHNLGYRADVTSIVAGKGVGTHSFTIADGNTSNNLSNQDGAGLLVIYSDPGDSTVYKVIVFEGLDFAFGRGDQLAEARVMAPVIFNHGATGAPRTADLVIFSGDATPDRPDRIDVTDAFGGATQFVNQLVGADGPQWDTFATT
jgi:Protein of unknown function (DUF3344)